MFALTIYQFLALLGHYLFIIVNDLLAEILRKSEINSQFFSNAFDVAVLLRMETTKRNLNYDGKSSIDQFVPTCSIQYCNGIINTNSKPLIILSR